MQESQLPLQQLMCKTTFWSCLWQCHQNSIMRVSCVHLRNLTLLTCEATQVLANGKRSLCRLQMCHHKVLSWSVFMGQIQDSYLLPYCAFNAVLGSLLTRSMERDWAYSDQIWSNERLISPTTPVIIAFRFPHLNSWDCVVCLELSKFKIALSLSIVYQVESCHGVSQSLYGNT